VEVAIDKTHEFVAERISDKLLNDSAATNNAYGVALDLQISESRNRPIGRHGALDVEALGETVPDDAILVLG